MMMMVVVVPVMMMMMMVVVMMVMVMVIGDARRTIRRSSTQLVRSLENSGGVWDRLQEFGESTRAHRAIDYIGRHGRLRRRDRRKRADSRQYTYDFLVHIPLLFVT